MELFERWWVVYCLSVCVCLVSGFISFDFLVGGAGRGGGGG